MTESALRPRSDSPENGKGRPFVKVTADLLARISENPDPVEYDLAGDAEALAPAMRDGRIDTPRRVQMFLANIIQETAALKTLAEYDSLDGTYLRSKRYYPYYGRGYIQLTWRDNYSAAGDALGVDLTADPSLLEGRSGNVAPTAPAIPAARPAFTPCLASAQVKNAWE